MSSEMSEDDFLVEFSAAMLRAVEDGPVEMPGMVRPPKATKQDNKGLLMIPEKMMSKPPPLEEEKFVECPYCEGHGWTPCVCSVERDTRCDGTGPCPACEGDGFVRAG